MSVNIMIYFLFQYTSFIYLSFYSSFSSPPHGLTEWHEHGIKADISSVLQASSPELPGQELLLVQVILPEEPLPRGQVVLIIWGREREREIYTDGDGVIGRNEGENYVIDRSLI